MRVELTGHQVDISPGLRNLVDRKLAKVTRVLNDAGMSAAVVSRKERVHNVVELTLHARGERFLHAVGKADTWQTAMTRPWQGAPPGREGEGQLAGAQAPRRSRPLGEDAARGPESGRAQDVRR